ncbi:MAG: hypothetical protein P1P86_16055 [Bacteroidales bacterium]|nr:hypothetical protein [Bacteroidales bacterium]
MPDTAIRRVDIPKVNTEVSVNHNISVKKWFYYQDNQQAHKHTFFIGNWKYGGEKLPYTGSISVSWDGTGSNAGIFATENTDVYILHSGNMGRRKKENFFEAYQGETKQIEMHDEIKNYAVVGRMDDPDIARQVVNFFDFLAGGETGSPDLPAPE